MLNQLIRSQVDIRGVIHVGAHYGQEYELYRDMGRVLLFEPVPSNFDVLQRQVGDSALIVNKAVGDRQSVVRMFVETANNGMSCSILRPTKHLSLYPRITFDSEIEVEQITLDGYLHEFGQVGWYNLLVIDTQGYELHVLRGANETLRTDLDFVVTEVYQDELYEGCPRVNEIDGFLNDFGFAREETSWDVTGTWGDAFYRRR